MEKYNGNNIDDVFREAFKDYKETPSVNIWNNINSKLFYQKYLKLSLTSLHHNIIVWTVVVSSIVSYSVYVGLSANKKETKNISAKEITEDTLKENIINENPILLTKNNNLPKTNIKQTELTTLSNNNANNLHNNSNILDQKDTTQDKSVTIFKSRDNEIKTEVASIKDYPLNLIKRRTFFDKNISTNKKIDSLLLLTNIVTPFYNSIKQKNYFMLNLYYSPSVVNRFYSINSGDNIIINIHNSININSYNSYGIELKYFYKNYFFGIGTNYSVMNSTIGIPENFMDYDSSKSHYNYNFQNFDIYTYGWNYNTNTPQILHYKVTTKDSTYVSIVDTLFSTKINPYKIKTTYLEVPLLIGYKIGKNKSSVDISSGVSINYLISNTLLVSKNSENIKNLEKNYFNKVMFNYLLRIGYSYNFTKNFAFTINGIFRYNINNLTKEKLANPRKFYSTGMNLGISYKL